MSLSKKLEERRSYRVRTSAIQNSSSTKSGMILGAAGRGGGSEGDVAAALGVPPLDGLGGACHEHILWLASDGPVAPTASLLEGWSSDPSALLNVGSLSAKITSRRSPRIRRTIFFFIGGATPIPAPVRPLIFAGCFFRASGARSWRRTSRFEDGGAAMRQARLRDMRRAAPDLASCPSRPAARTNHPRRNRRPARVRKKHE